MSIGEIFEGKERLDFPQSEFFSGNLFEESDDTEQKLRMSSNYNKFTGNSQTFGSGTYTSEMRESQQKALEKRQKRMRLELPPSYKLLAEKIRKTENRERNIKCKNRMLSIALDHQMPLGYEYMMQMLSVGFSLTINKNYQ